MPLAAGTRLGPYEVLGLIGAGGMGEVYKARDTRLGRLAALKVIRGDWAADPDRRRRFIREAQSASALNHPSILTIYEIDAAGGLDYIAMEYVAGGTLADILQAGPVGQDRALRMAAQVADALEAAHTASIVHRDLKPSNIMVAAGDRVKVVDFGLAKLVASAADETTDALTIQGQAVGTTPTCRRSRPPGSPSTGAATCSVLGSCCTDAGRSAAVLRRLRRRHACRHPPR